MDSARLLTHPPPDGPRFVTDADVPDEASTEARLAAMLNWAVQAPSVLNTQPWRFRVGGDGVSVFVDRSRVLAAVDPEGREAVVSCGAALFTLRLAARHYGETVAVEVAGPDDAPDLVGTLRLTGHAPPTASEETLFRAIKARHTNRAPYADLEVPVGLLARLHGAAEAEGARLHVLTADADRAALADLVGRAIRAQSDHESLEEIGAWARGAGDDRPDGVADVPWGGWGRMGHLHADPRFAIAEAWALVASAPALLVVATDADDRAAWARAGAALQHVLLLGAAHGLAASYFNQPTEVDDLRPEVSAVAGVGHAQVVFRLGTPVETPGTPRRSIDDVLATAGG